MYIITITIIASVQVKEGKMDEAKEILRDLTPKIKKAEPGTLEYIPHTVKGRNEKNTIIFYEKYEDSAALREHSANLAKSLKPLMPLLKPGMDLKTCFKIV